LTDFDKIWYNDESGTFTLDWPLKFLEFENPTWQIAAISATVWPILTKKRRGDASGTSTPDQPLKFLENRNPKWQTDAILKTQKILISRQQFEQFC